MPSDSGPPGGRTEENRPMDAPLLLTAVLLVVALLGALAESAGVDTRDGFARDGWV